MLVWDLLVALFKRYFWLIPWWVLHRLKEKLLRRVIINQSNISLQRVNSWSLWHQLTSRVTFLLTTHPLIINSSRTLEGIVPKILIIIWIFIQFPFLRPLRVYRIVTSFSPLLVRNNWPFLIRWIVPGYLLSVQIRISCLAPYTSLLVKICIIALLQQALLVTSRPRFHF
jgi:hypothetical protein